MDSQTPSVQVDISTPTAHNVLLYGNLKKKKYLQRHTHCICYTIIITLLLFFCVGISIIYLIKLKPLISQIDTALTKVNVVTDLIDKMSPLIGEIQPIIDKINPIINQTEYFITITLPKVLDIGNNIYPLINNTQEIIPLIKQTLNKVNILIETTNSLEYSVNKLINQTKIYN
jgi:hypothetical protein